MQQLFMFKDLFFFLLLYTVSVVVFAYFFYYYYLHNWKQQSSRYCEQKKKWLSSCLKTLLEPKHLYMQHEYLVSFQMHLHFYLQPFRQRENGLLVFTRMLFPLHTLPQYLCFKSCFSVVGKVLMSYWVKSTQCLLIQPVHMYSKKRIAVFCYAIFAKPTLKE